jgi:hypothetical protein|tara:strand:+ start:434 stop:631 length:198 start_codon:yes stop_codon:yes gene_type:complete
MLGIKTQILNSESKDILRKSLGMFISKTYQSHSEGRIDEGQLHELLHTVEEITDLLYLKYVENLE